MKRILLFLAIASPAFADDDMDALWKDASQWEVGSAVDSVRAARKKLIALGEKSLDYMIPAKLAEADTIITRAFGTVIVGMSTPEKDADEATARRAKELRGKAIERLLPCLDLDKPIVRRNAADLLGQLGATEAAPKIATLLKDKDARGGALVALGALKAVETAPAIIELLNASDSPERLRVACIGTLGSLGGDAAQEAFLRALADAAAPVRFAAQYALEKLKAVEPLEKKTGDRDLRVRLHAISALGRIGDKAARGTLIPLLDDPLPLVRGFAAEALAAMPEAGDREMMKKHLESELHPFARGKMEEALAK